MRGVVAGWIGLQAWLVATMLVSSVSLSCGMSSVSSHPSRRVHPTAQPGGGEVSPSAVSREGRELLPDVVEAGKKIVASGEKRRLTFFCEVWRLRWF